MSRRRFTKARRTRAPQTSAGPAAICCPYWRMVMISIVCAVFVSVAFTGGLGTLLPIMRVLINGDTVAQWADAQIVEKRLGVKLADVADVVKIVHVEQAGRRSPGGLEGLRPDHLGWRRRFLGRRDCCTRFPTLPRSGSANVTADSGEDDADRAACRRRGYWQAASRRLPVTAHSSGEGHRRRSRRHGRRWRF